jgi:hypothetical protein
MRQPGRTIMALIALLVALFGFGGCVAERVNTQGMTAESKVVARRASIGSIRIPPFLHPSLIRVYEQQTGEWVGTFYQHRAEPVLTVPAGTYKLKFGNYFLENITVKAGQEVVLEQ